MKYRNGAFYITRFDEGEFTLKNKKSTFKAGDIVEFKIYNENGLDEEPLLVKEFTTEEGSDSIKIILYSADTNFVEPSNETQTFWYEIVLNGVETIAGFDENKAKYFYVYPRGIDKK